ncbi:MAG: histidine phosphatase family protein [Blautia sp.]|nr:histidine phosphatase family protein [Lachnospiraceae bacterium]MBP3901909.1 histidine phosphatase family protein [Blautia sp.]
MRTIYLVRHAQPEIERGVCLGRKDVKLSHEGEKQAQRLARYFAGKNISAIMHSPLKRCEATARIIAEYSGNKNIKRVPEDGLTEVDTGLWDGLPFSEIEDKWPREYEERGRHMGRTVMPGGESFMQAGERFYRCLDTLAGNEEGDLLIVAHAGVIRSLLCILTGTDIDRLMDFHIPYASVTILREGAAHKGASPETAERSGRFCPEVNEFGLRPIESISLSEVDRMWKECGVTPELRSHMETVADMAMNLIEYDPWAVQADCFDTAYKYRGGVLNTRLLYYGALLHDIRRAEGGRIHASAGAAYLAKQGYKELSLPVKLHHDPDVYRPGEPLDEAEVLYYADKLVQGSRPVSLEERFAKSFEKCRDPEARKMHEARYVAALGIREKLN